MTPAFTVLCVLKAVHYGLLRIHDSLMHPACTEIIYSFVNMTVFSVPATAIATSLQRPTTEHMINPTA